METEGLTLALISKGQHSGEAKRSRRCAGRACAGPFAIIPQDLCGSLERRLGSCFRFGLLVLTIA